MQLRVFHWELKNEKWSAKSNFVVWSFIKWIFWQDSMEEEWSSWLWGNNFLHLLQQCLLPGPPHPLFLLPAQELQPHVVSFLSDYNKFIFVFFFLYYTSKPLKTSKEHFFQIPMWSFMLWIDVLSWIRFVVGKIGWDADYRDIYLYIS